MPEGDINEVVKMFKTLPKDRQKIVLKKMDPGQQRLMLDALSKPETPESWPHYAVRKGVEFLPTIGATAGGIAGGPSPLAPIGAGAGAVAGEAARQELTSRFPSLGEAPKGNMASLEEMGKQGVIGAVTEMIPFDRMADWAKRTAPLTYAKIFGKVGETLTPRTEKTVGTLLERNKVFPSRSAMTREAKGATEALGPKLATAEAGAAHEQFNVAPILTDLKKIEDNLFVKGTGKNVAGGFQGVAKYETEGSRKALNAIRNQIQDSAALGQISRESLLSIKQRLADVAYNSGTFKERGVELTEAVERDMEKSLRNILQQPRPDIAKLDAEFSLWKSVQELVNPTKATAERSLGRFEKAKITGAGLGLVGGVAAGHTAETAGVVAALYAIDRATQSVAWNSTLGVIKNRMAEALANGNFQLVIRLASRIGAQEGTKALPQTPTEARDRINQAVKGVFSP